MAFAAAFNMESKINTARRSQDKIPKIPVVAKREGIKPKPKLKLASQKIVWLIAVGLCIDQAAENRFGPIPSIGFSFKAPFITVRVEETEGRTSTFFISK